MDENLKRRLQKLIEELHTLNSENANRSYSYLIDALGTLDTGDVISNSGAIIYHMVDSYNGDKVLGDRIHELLYYIREAKTGKRS